MIVDKFLIMNRASFFLWWLVVALDGEMLDSRSYLIIIAARVQWQVVVSGNQYSTHFVLFIHYMQVN